MAGRAGREIVETLGSEAIEAGLFTGAFNSRGVTNAAFTTEASKNALSPTNTARERRRPPTHGAGPPVSSAASPTATSDTQGTKMRVRRWSLTPSSAPRSV